MRELMQSKGDVDLPAFLTAQNRKPFISRSLEVTSSLKGDIMRYVIALAAVLALAGCKSPSVNYTDLLATLQDGEARGHLTVTAGGSPLSVGGKTVFFLGPENASIAFDGDIDFRKETE